MQILDLVKVKYLTVVAPRRKSYGGNGCARWYLEGSALRYQQLVPNNLVVKANADLFKVGGGARNVARKENLCRYVALGHTCVNFVA
jgi:hypothetical protein